MVDAIMTLALCVALWRRPGVVSLALACAYFYGCTIADLRHHDDLRPLIMAGDAFVIIVLHRQRGTKEEALARVSVALSLFSITVGFAAALEGWRWNTYAMTINAITIAQALFATGYGDGLLAWLGHRLNKFRDQRVVRARPMGVWR